MMNAIVCNHWNVRASAREDVKSAGQEDIIHYVLGSMDPCLMFQCCPNALEL
ncbi:hypothetical protein RchiOBHm_Chr1g0339331 [Rosa chinensis]|uniref:Uncharacterized protein n=1 Tax=Rosa chinensis TaxID=74649 RepID=A0A2P6SD64_ROSCH|nr:hypothetical protein RchiOBHm_Chr1g0339331 [Rosa chinensis]